MSFFRILIVLSVFAILTDCTSSRLSMQNRNVAMLYNPVSTTLHPEFLLFHGNDSASQLYFHIYTDELLFNKANSESEEKAKVKIQYLLFNLGEVNKFADSSSVTFDIIKKTTGKEFITCFTIKINPGAALSLELITTDMLRNNSHLCFIIVDKKTVITKQNYLVTTPHDPRPLFHNFFTSKDTVVIKNYRAKPVMYTVQYYKEYNQSPLPPFSLTPYKPVELFPDSIWKIKTENEMLYFSMRYRGIYHFLADTAKSDGLTLFNMGDYYPLVRTAGEMIKPVRYISTSKEYRNLEMVAHEKAGIDSFWLKSSGNINRARELIRVFYSRVNFANIYFTGFMPGWLSDRGMIYIVYGPPKTIYKSDDSERWIYGDNRNLMSMDFYFQKMDSKFSDNYFVLKRGEIYKSSWYQATDTWRNGRIYSVVN